MRTIKGTLFSGQLKGGESVDTLYRYTAKDTLDFTNNPKKQFESIGFGEQLIDDFTSTVEGACGAESTVTILGQNEAPVVNDPRH